MKMNKILAFALAGMAFAACSNEDSPTENAGNAQGEIVDAIRIRLVSSGSTRANDGIEAGLDQENKLYHAFVFAKESAPQHTAARVGDWTVKEVGDGNTEIAAGSASGNLGNIATFSGVRQGDNVYVLANYPDLTITEAERLAHNGTKSEESIKAFIANVQKDYLGSLNYSSENAGAPDANSKYIMGGMGTIPVSPTIPNGQTVVVPVKLDREMAKVHFQASVTTDPQYAAYKKVELTNGQDGIIVARVSRKVSPFTTQATGFYFPSSAEDKDKDWNVTGWLKAFDGETKAAADGTGTTVPFFNNELHNADAKEYRYTWDLSNATNTDVRVYMENNWMKSPFFYVTPNYSNNAGTATVIATQATYVGAPVFTNEDANVLFVKGFGIYTKTNPDNFQDEFGVNANSFSKCVWTDTAITTMHTNLESLPEGDKKELAKLCGWNENETGKVDAAITELKKVTKVVSLDPADGTDAETIKNLDYYHGMKLFYRADIANYDDTNTISLLNTERNSYYKIRATITSLGAKSIEDAITSSNIGMQVEVTVNPWNVVFNDINM